MLWISGGPEPPAGFEAVQNLGCGVSMRTLSVTRQQLHLVQHVWWQADVKHQVSCRVQPLRHRKAAKVVEKMPVHDQRRIKKEKAKSWLSGPRDPKTFHRTTAGTEIIVSFLWSFGTLRWALGLPSMTVVFLLKNSKSVQCV